jgi:hypothetical protein
MLQKELRKMSVGSVKNKGENRMLKGKDFITRIQIQATWTRLGHMDTQDCSNGPIIWAHQFYLEQLGAFRMPRCKEHVWKLCKLCIPEYCGMDGTFPVLFLGM